MTYALAAADAVLELVATHREEAEQSRRLAPDRAALLEEIAAEYEEAVTATLPTWVTLRDVQARTGWSMQYLRERAERLAEQGLAKKAPHWLIERDAALAMPRRPGHEEVKVLDLETARALGREE